MSETTERKVPMVFRIIRVPKVIWENQIVPLMQLWSLEIPDKDFSVYRWIKLEKFVLEAKHTFFTKLLALCLRRAGIEINMIHEMPVVTFTTADNEEEYNETVSIVKAMTAHRYGDQQYREKQREIIEKYPAAYTRIKDVLPTEIQEETNNIKVNQ